MAQTDVYLESDQVSYSDSSSSGILQVALLANGAFSGISGFAVMLFAPQVNAWLGTADAVPDAALVFGGGGLCGYALFLFFVAMSAKIPALSVKVAIGADIGWVVGSAVLLALFPEAVSPVGFWVVAIIAVIVAIFALLQYVGLRGYRYSEGNDVIEGGEGDDVLPLCKIMNNIARKSI